MPPLTLPASHWTEPPTPALRFASLAPYQTAAGYWVFLASSDTPPVGSTRGALVATSDYNTLTTSTTTGRSLRRNAGGPVFLR